LYRQHCQVCVLLCCTRRHARRHIYTIDFGSCTRLTLIRHCVSTTIISIRHTRRL
jgi:hypothetical protein